MKTQSIFTCSNCGFQTNKWVGKCQSCENWNSFVEEIQKKELPSARKIKSHARAPHEFRDILKNLETQTKRWITGIGELDRVIGGGIIPGSIILLGGEPGIGKSTLTLQLCEKLSLQNKNIIYFSAEESEEQISLRAKRLSLSLENFKILNETNLETILGTIENENADFAVIDSIQTISSGAFASASGTVSQVRFCTESITNLAKPKKLPVLITGHVTKDGTLAGPRVLEHLVDSVLMLEGDRNSEFRILRGVKNRFGSVNEIGIFEMSGNGMIEIKNPSEKFLSGRNKSKIGSAVICTMEGTRIFFVEVQALIVQTKFGYPRRAASGFDVNRLNLLLAVLERNLKLNFGNKDVYINAVGGFRLSEPSADLGVCVAIISSLKEKPAAMDIVFAGEVGLSSEILKPSRFDLREKETEKLGFRILPKFLEQNYLHEILKQISL